MAIDSARIRSRGAEAEALGIPLAGGGAQIPFFEAQRAIAPGKQSSFIGRMKCWAAGGSIVWGRRVTTYPSFRILLPSA